MPIRKLPSAVALVTAAIWLAPPSAAAQAISVSIPTPASVLGFEPGEDRRLARWEQVVAYFEALGQSSPRIQVRTLGSTTLGRPFLAAFIADSSTLANLPGVEAAQRTLADPRGRSDAARNEVMRSGKLVVLVTSSIHSTEVGAILTPLVLAHKLVTDTAAEAAMIRREALVILVPSLNPDGVDIVHDWYVSTLGTPWEGASPPVLYHHYTGHDNNRDWYAFTQVETRLTVDSLHNVWRPHIVNDIHQQQPNAGRLFIPPYMDPIEPNVDPLVIGAVNQLGLAMVWRLTREGKTGIATNASYDAWTPARAYQHYRGGARILTETASARLATPIDLPLDSLRPARGYDPRVRSWNFTTIWPGGRWSLSDIMDYQVSSTWALLAEAARDRESWLENFARVHERAVAGQAAPGRENWPVAFVIPQRETDRDEFRALARILQRGQVEVHRASSPFQAGGVTYPAGSIIIYTAQPYGAFAKALLEKQTYPDLREYPGGPPKRPYDVTAHTLPLLMGVQVAEVGQPFSATTTLLPTVPEPRMRVAGLSGPTRRRIALYRSFSPSMDEGWTRWILDQYGIPYANVTDRDIRAGALANHDVLVLPDQSARTLSRGVAQREYPDTLSGGLGTEGAQAIARFVRGGGTLLAFNRASEWAISALSLPVRNALEGVPDADFYGPGSLLRVRYAERHPVTRRLVGNPPIWFEESPVFEITDDSRVTVLAAYVDPDPLASGWLLGGERLAGKAAMVEIREGNGKVVLYGFRPQYRAQSMATYPLIWGAVLER